MSAFCWLRCHEMQSPPLEFACCWSELPCRRISWGRKSRSPVSTVAPSREIKSTTWCYSPHPLLTFVKAVISSCSRHLSQTKVCSRLNDYVACQCYSQASDILIFGNGEMKWANINDKYREEYMPTTNENVELAIGVRLPRCRRHRPVYLLSHSKYQRPCSYRPNSCPTNKLYYKRKEKLIAYKKGYGGVHIHCTRFYLK